MNRSSFKLWIFLLSILSFSLAQGQGGFDNYGGTDTSDESYQPSIIPEAPVYELPGESIDLVSRSLRYEVTDLHVSGSNGLDLSFSRYYDQGDTISHQYAYDWSRKGMPIKWHIGSLASISYKVGGSDPLSNNYQCLGYTGQVAFRMFGGRSLQSYGYSNSNKMPSNSVAAFLSGEVLVCDGQTPVILTPDGLRVSFGEVTPNQQLNSIISYRSRLVSLVEDRFGNSITYNYDSSSLLQSMVRDDGARIDLQWSGTSLSSITSGNRTISYNTVATTETIPITNSYGITNNIALFEYQVTDAAGQTTVYKQPIGGGNYIHSVSFPSGIEVTYDVTESRHNDFSSRGTWEAPYEWNVAVRERQITHPDSSLRTTAYGPSMFEPESRNDHPQSITNSIVQYDDQLGEYIEYKYEFFDTTSDVTHHENGWARLNGKQIQLKVFQGNTLKYQVDTGWVRKTSGTVGCVNGTAMWGYTRSCTRAVKDSQLITVYDLIGNNVYRTDYDSYDEYGNLLTWNETLSGGSGKRYHKQNYLSDTTNWLLGLPTTTYISETGYNSGLILSDQTTYYSATGAYKSSPNLVYKYGLQTHTYSSYHATGDLNKLSYPGTTNYEIYDQYENGRYQRLRKPKRYTAGENTLTRVVDDFGNITEETDFNGNLISYGFDGLNRLISIDYSDSQWADVSILYESVSSPDTSLSGVYAGTRKQTYTSGDYEKTTFYDGYDQPVLVREQDLSDSSTTAYVNSKYNYSGKLIFQSLPSSSPSEPDGQAYVFDAIHRPVTVTETSVNNQTFYGYLSANRTVVIDPGSYSTTTTYQAYGHPQASMPTKIASPAGVTTDFEYDLMGKVTSVSQGNGVAQHTQTYVYDNYERLCKVYRPEFGWTYNAYNSANTLSWQAVVGGAASATTCDTGSVSSALKASYTYDNQNTLWKTSFGDGTSDRVRTLDAGGNLTDLDFGDRYWSYAYNSRNLPYSQSLSVDGKNLAMTTFFNSLGYVDGHTYPSGRQLSYGVNALGQVESVGDYVTSANYYPSGTLDSITYANGVTYSIALNDRSLPNHMTVENAQSVALSDLYYGYDANGNINLITDYLDSTYTVDGIVYDGLNRLKEADGYWGQGSITYDQYSNINTKSLGSQSLVYNYDSQNRLDNVTGSNGYSFSYDSRGNVTNNGSRSFFYNLANQMTVSGGLVYQYDGHNRRVSKTLNGQTEYSFYDLDGTLLYRQKANGDHVDYHYLNSHLVTTVESR